MYTNVITENCQLFFPLPEECEPPSSSRASISGVFGRAPRELPPAIENGLNFTWRRLRLGQYWGGDGECCLQFNAEELSASGHVDGNLHGQVGGSFGTLRNIVLRREGRRGGGRGTRACIAKCFDRFQVLFFPVDAGDVPLLCKWKAHSHSLTCQLTSAKCATHNKQTRCLTVMVLSMS